MRPDIQLNLKQLSLSELYAALSNINDNLQNITQLNTDEYIHAVTYRDAIVLEIDSRSIEVI